MWCIKCGGDGCFIWKLPPSLACTSLLSSSAFNLIALVVYLQSPKRYLFLGLIGWAVVLGFPNLSILIGPSLTWWIVRLSCTCTSSGFPFPQIHFSNLCMHCNLKPFLRIALLRICAYGSISIEPIGSHQASIAPLFAFALTHFYCHHFCMMKMRKLWMTTRCYSSNSLSLFLCCSLFVYST